MFAESTAEEFRADSYKGLWKMYQRKRSLAHISKEWTKWGLDMREGYFWAGPEVGKYVKRVWMQHAPRDNTHHFRSKRIPPLRCDRPEYVKPMIMHWARFTGVQP